MRRPNLVTASIVSSKNLGPRYRVWHIKLSVSSLYYLYQMSRGRPRKYRTKRESKTAKKAHTKSLVPLNCALTKVGMKEKKQRGFSGQQIPSNFFNWMSSRACVLNWTTKTRINGSLYVTCRSMLTC